VSKAMRFPRATRRRRPVDRAGLSRASVLAAALLSGGAHAAEVTADTSTCAAIADLARPDFLVEKAEIVPAGPAPSAGGEGEPLPEHCLVQGMLNPRLGADGRSFGIGFDLRMPTVWNGRFAFHGGGGLDGVLNPALGDIFGSVRPSALARGFAVVSSDGGHRSPTFLDPTFALDQQARLDYAFNAMDRVTLKAKALVERYYDSAPEHSYLLGCSNGGRQGMLASQRFPHHFDGIVAGDPAFKLSRIAMDQAWNIQVAARIAPQDEAAQFPPRVAVAALGCRAPTSLVVARVAGAEATLSGDVRAARRTAGGRQLRRAQVYHSSPGSPVSSATISRVR